MTDRPIVLVSNRGPVSFSLDDSGEPVAQRGAGGLVSGLGPLLTGTDSLWVAAAMSDADRTVAGRGATEAEGLRVRLLDIDPATYRASYETVCNATLWFAHHGMFDTPRRPVLDRRWHEAWQAYRAVNAAFAEAVAEDAPQGAVVLVQDYHLCLVGPALADSRPDLATVHFSHTPFAGPDELRTLPDAVAHELLEGLAGHTARGFHCRRWADAFEASCRAVLGRDVPAFVAPLAPDPGDLASSAARPATAQAAEALEGAVGDRQLLLRVDRIEPSKNLLRGFWAFEELLEAHPEHRGRVTFAAFVYPSRESLAEYLAYRQEAETLIERINERWGTEGWTPILGDLRDDYPRSVAALGRFDVLLVNPVRDGLNLVALEGALLNQRDGAVVLSTEAGVHEQVATTPDAVISINPFDVHATAEALHRALTMDADERARRAGALRGLAEARTPADWLADQLAAVAR